MKVLLIQPPSCDPLTDRIFLFEPLALEYLGAGLKEDGHEVRLLDARLEPDIDGAVDLFRPDLVGLTGFTSHLNIVKDIARRLKKRAPTTLVVVGGHHATVRPEDFNTADIDMVVIGEGVFTLREIVRAVETGGRLADIRGVAIPAPLHSPRQAPLPRPEPDRSLPEALLQRMVQAARLSAHLPRLYRPL